MHLGPEWKRAESCSNRSNKTLIFIFPIFPLLNARKIIFTSSLSERRHANPTSDMQRTNVEAQTNFLAQDVALATFLPSCKEPAEMVWKSIYIQINQVCSEHPASFDALSIALRCCTTWTCCRHGCLSQSGGGDARGWRVIGLCYRAAAKPPLSDLTPFSSCLWGERPNTGVLSPVQGQVLPQIIVQSFCTNTHFFPVRNFRPTGKN